MKSLKKGKGTTRWFPPQHQKRQPGRERQMRPRPQSTARTYRAANRLSGKVAFITGGDSGIGRAVAIAFAKEGADVAVVYLEEYAPAYVFLASDDSFYMTGQVLHPNGGEIING